LPSYLCNNRAAEAWWSGSRGLRGGVEPQGHGGLEVLEVWTSGGRVGIKPQRPGALEGVQVWTSGRLGGLDLWRSCRHRAAEAWCSGRHAGISGGLEAVQVWR